MKKNYFSTQYTEANGPVLFGRNAILNKIEDYVIGKKVPENIAMLGVKGIGKTSIIKKAFCESKTEQYYRENNILVVHLSMPETTETMKGFYSYLMAATYEALDKTENYNKAKYDDLMRNIEEEKNKAIKHSLEIDDATVRSVFDRTVDCIIATHLKLLIIIDDFEFFAQSSKLKKDQYKFLRSMANENRISLFIATGQDLTMVSDEIKGSGFENIFTYVPLKGILPEHIEDWLLSVSDNLQLDIDDEYLDWVENISGGIPEVVASAGELLITTLLNNRTLEKNLAVKELRLTLTPLMNSWWKNINLMEHSILKDIIENKISDTNQTACLVKKGYLETLDSGKFAFSTPMFELFVIEKMNSSQIDDDFLKNSRIDDIKTVIREIMVEENHKIEKKFEEKFSDISNKLASILQDMPTREDYYKTENGEFDCYRYQEAISEYISKRLTQNDYKEICSEWNIDISVWNSLSGIRRNDCSMAYNLASIVFCEDVVDLDYTPVIVMLGNFLEGLLNDYMLCVMKKLIPDFKIRKKSGEYINLENINEDLMIGGFGYIFSKSDIVSVLSSLCVAGKINLDNSAIFDFNKKLIECRNIRNKADHPGDIITYEDKNLFINNMFLSPNGMFKTMCNLKSLESFAE